MKITKYDHACLVVEENNKKLVIDPGVFSPSFQASPDTVAVVITHVHSDHLDPQKLQQIKAASPDVRIFSVQDVADELKDMNIEVVQAGEGVSVEPFHLEFCGGEHAIIHPSRPPVQNVGVVVNETLYYPGDSFAPPCRDIRVLAIPAAAPWLKISEPMDYIAQTKAEINFPTHDAILSEAGQQLSDSLIASVAEQAGLSYKRIAVGETLEV
jgi:hypothetical protein